MLDDDDMPYVHTVLHGVSFCSSHVVPAQCFAPLKACFIFVGQSSCTNVSFVPEDQGFGVQGGHVG